MSQTWRRFAELFTLFSAPLTHISRPRTLFCSLSFSSPLPAACGWGPLFSFLEHGMHSSSRGNVKEPLHHQARDRKRLSREAVVRGITFHSLGQAEGPDSRSYFQRCRACSYIALSLSSYYYSLTRQSLQSRASSSVRDLWTLGMDCVILFPAAGISDESRPLTPWISDRQEQRGEAALSFSCSKHAFSSFIHSQ